MGFKEDADFARFVSMGAIGSAQVADDLRGRLGHDPIELERYAMSNKVWQTKVKRLRLPDLVCASCGVRVESRAKSKLGIILSHSDVPGREWDAGGMRETDLYAFLRVQLGVDLSGAVSTPHYLSTAALRASLTGAKRSAAKAASEGSEVTLTWPHWVPKKSGRFIETDSEGRLFCEFDDGSSYRYYQWKGWPSPGYVYLTEGSEVIANETILAGIVPHEPPDACPGRTWDLGEALKSGDEVDHYAAAKVVGLRGRADLEPALRDTLGRNLDWRVAVESLGSLARLGDAAAIDGILAFAHSDEAEQQMEAAFVLGELGSDEASDALAALAADREFTKDLRAAAAWGLGQAPGARADLALSLTVDDDEFVALHAITGIDELPDSLVRTLQGWLAESNQRHAAVAAQLLLRHEKIEALVDASLQGEPARLWALRALGDLPKDLVLERAAGRLDPESLAALGPLWQAQGDWLRTGGAEGLEALDVQKVRFDPGRPTLSQ